MSLGLETEIAHHVKARAPRSRALLRPRLQCGPGSQAGREEGRGQARCIKLVGSAGQGVRGLPGSGMCGRGFNSFSVLLGEGVQDEEPQRPAQCRDVPGHWCLM